MNEEAQCQTDEVHGSQYCEVDNDPSPPILFDVDTHHGLSVTESESCRIWLTDITERSNGIQNFISELSTYYNVSYYNATKIGLSKLYPSTSTGLCLFQKY